MNELVTIVVSAGGASERMLRTCLCGLARHPNKVGSKIVVVAPQYQGAVIEVVCEPFGIECRLFSVDEDNMSGSRLHAKVLDLMVPLIDTPMMLTLDVDCFPMRDGWLDELVRMKKEENAGTAGILQPYAPPSEDMAKTGIEYRIRSQFSHENTHVACQLISMDTLSRLGVGFSDGDDTNFGIVKAVHDAGMSIVGWKPTKCGVPYPALDAEFNRERCVVFGDNWVYHHGGGCRENQGRGVVSDSYRHVQEKVLEVGGAEFLIDDPAWTYEYQFDKEEEVADAMVRSLLRGMAIHLQTNQSVFKS